MRKKIAILVLCAAPMLAFAGLFGLQYNSATTNSQPVLNVGGGTNIVGTLQVSNIPAGIVLALTNTASAPTSNSFVAAFGYIATNAASTNLIIQMTGAHLTYYWTTNGLVINNSTTAP